MADHTATPWKVFTTPDGFKLVGIGSQEGEGILDCGFGVWAWDDAEGVANANLVVKAVNAHDALVNALEELISLSAAMDDCNCTSCHLVQQARALLASIKEHSK